MLPRQNRLKTSNDFDSVYKKGRHYKGRFGKFIVLNRSDDKPARIGIVISAKRGNAVTRNKARRQIREAIRSLDPSDSKFIDKPYDISYIVWSAEFSFAEMKDEIKNLARASGLV